MGRPLRVDYPGAIHHVNNRGVRGMNIFTNPDERNYFIELLKKYTAEYQIELLAYSLMPNHFHLILRSTSGRLSDFMSVLQSKYATWFNQQSNRESGRLMQARFDNQLIQSEQYFHQAVLYVLTNPQRSGLVPWDKLIHPWTALGDLENPLPSPVHWEILLNLWGANELDEFLHELIGQAKQIDADYNLPARTERRIRFLGDDDFLEIVLDQAGKATRSRSNKKGPIEPEVILEFIKKAFELEAVDTITDSKYQPRFTEARYCAAYFLRSRGHCSLAEIGELLNTGESAISELLRKNRAEHSEKIRQVIQKGKRELR